MRWQWLVLLGVVMGLRGAGTSSEAATVVSPLYQYRQAPWELSRACILNDEAEICRLIAGTRENAFAHFELACAVYCSPKTFLCLLER